MKKILCIVLALALLLLSGCVSSEYRAKHALYHYDSYSDDATFVAAALDDLNGAAQEGGDAYNELLQNYGKSRVMTEAVLGVVEDVFLDETADCIRRVDAYNLLVVCGPNEEQLTQWKPVLDEPITLPDDAAAEAADGAEDSEPLRYFCVFLRHWNTGSSDEPPTPYTTISTLRGIPRGQLAASASKADRVFLCDVTYTMTTQYSVNGRIGAAQGYTAEVNIQIQNRHSGLASDNGTFSFDPPDSFEAQGAVISKLGEIRYDLIASSLRTDIQAMG